MTSEKPSSPHVCEHCKDTHLMPLDGRYVPCTRCPTPCEKCRKGGTGAFCEHTPCACECHDEVKPIGKLVIETEDRLGAEPPAHPLDIDRSARRSDTAHPADFNFVWSNSQQALLDKARDKLLLELGQAMLVLMNQGMLSHRSRDDLGRAVHEFQVAMRQ